MRFTVVGTPGERRTELFTAACLRAGLDAPRVVPWTDVLLDEFEPVEPGSVLRIESPGGDVEVDAILRGPGDPSRVGGGARWYATLTGAVERVAGLGAPMMNDADDIAVMFDKRRCHARLSAAGVPVPEALPPVHGHAELHEQTTGAGVPVHGGAERRERTTDAGMHLLAAGVPVPQALLPVHGCVERCERMVGAGVPIPEALASIRGYAELRERMAGAGVRQVFVKPAHGSSASGVVALQTAPGGRIKAVTSAEFVGDGYRNSLRVRSYGTEAEVARLVDALAPDGLHVERWLPKAALDGRLLDLRVVVIAGEPTHAVVRTSRSPMTNLHLGGARGSLDAVREALGPSGWERALEVCASAASCFPGSLMVGVDLLVQIGWRRFAVGEVNAFGDLLPGVMGLPGSSAEGVDTYTAQVNAVLSGKVALCTT